MFKNLKAKAAFMLLLGVGLATAWLVDRYFIAVWLAVLTILATLLYAHRHLPGGLPGPWQVIKAWGRPREKQEQNVKKNARRKKRPAKP